MVRTVRSMAISISFMTFLCTTSGPAHGLSPQLRTSDNAAGQSIGALPPARTSANQKMSCIYAAWGADGWNLAGITQEVQAVTAVTGVTYNCIETFATADPQWSDWVDPWVTRYPGDPVDGFDAWASEPGHRLILSIDLIPDAVSDNSDPLTWEAPCAAGQYDTYATQLGRNLVAEGVANTIVRLGLEANGTWENDFVGTTTTEEQDWADCFDQEVGSMRAVAGSHFVFVWNPNACTEALPVTTWYPGDAYVDVVGLDQYDQSCSQPSTAVSWSTLYNQNYGLAQFLAFARAHGKPMAVPEWGMDASPAGDDPAYVSGMAQLVNGSGNVMFQSYFDAGDDGVLSLGSDAPRGTAVYKSDF
jgi:hypothetical protein